MPAKRRTRAAASTQELTSGAGGGRGRRTGRTTRARQHQTTGGRGLLAEARDMAQSVGQSTLGAARAVASGTRRGAVAVGNTTGKAATKVAGEVWDNKVPALLIGAGATWWAIDSARGRGNSNGRRGRRGGVRGAGRFAAEAASAVADAGRAVGGRVAQFVRDNPVLAGAATVGVGVTLGLVMPPTETENALVGNAREKLVRRAKEAARGTVRNVTESVARVTGRNK